MTYLKSLALLKAHWDSRRDYIDNFVPFVAECIRLEPPSVIALLPLQEALERRFGIRIPQGALKTILKRARRRGYVQVDGRERVFTAVPAKLATLGLDALAQSVEAQFDGFVREFIAYALEKHSRVLDPMSAETLVAGFLGRHSLPIMEAAVTGQPLAMVAPPSASDEFVLATFITGIQRGQAPTFAFLETVAKGHVLATALLYPNVAEIKKGFEGIEVFLDTPLLLRALGYSSAEMEAPCREMLALLSELGAETKCFRHTLTELENVLYSVHELLKDPRRLRDGTGDVLQHFLDCNATSTDIDLEITELPLRLRGIGVKVVDTPPHTRELGLNEEMLEAMLQEAVRYKNAPARERDLASLTAIHRLRHGDYPARFESCRAVFVTTNHPLARVSSDYFKSERDRGRAGAIVPHCLLDDVFTALVWLKAPQKVPDLPVKRVISECYAAVNPSPALWKRYLDELNKLESRGAITADEYTLLRFSREARALLMDRTFGEVEAFGEGTVTEVLQVARQNLRADAEARAAAGEARAEKAEAAEEDARRSAIARDQARRGRMKGIADRVSQVAAIGISGLLTLALFVGGGVLEPWSGRRARGGWLGTFLGGAAWVGACFGLWSGLSGGSVASLRTSLQRRLSRRIEGLLLRLVE